MNSKAVLDLLRKYESRNITFVDPDGTWPIVWDRAQGVYVWDIEGRKYLDLTAAFGVAACGHANRKVVKAGQAQMERLLHAVGDVHPHALKAQLARELSRITFERWGSGKKTKTTHKSTSVGKTIFCNSGFEAVEAALKTAFLATGKAGIIAFEGAYHGLGYGALNATHRSHFTAPFKAQLRKFGQFVPFPSQDASKASLSRLEEEIRAIFKRKPTGAILAEPIQARGGINVPPADFLKLLRKIADEQGAVLILDEVYTGFGRTGRWFACEHFGVTPDIICLGKALTGGFPLSACVGRAELMDYAWPVSNGEAIHTSTFLGHPVGCAMALAQLNEIKTQDLVNRCAVTGKWLLNELHGMCQERAGLSARGSGLLVGVEVRDRTGKPATGESLDVIKRMLHKGYVLLPEGEHANVLSFSPPLTITKAQLGRALDALSQTLGL